MTISFNVPGGIEDSLRRRGCDPNQAIKEAALVDLYRRREITHHQLAEGLGLGRLAVDDVLKRHDVPIEQTLDDVRAEMDAIRRGRAE